MDKALLNLFWDSDPEKINYQKNAPAVIQRILEFGNPDQVRFMLEKYDRQIISRTLKKCRNLTSKSANFWADYFDLPKEEILCLNKPSARTPKNNWPY